MTERCCLRGRSGQDDDKKRPSYFSCRDEAGSNGRQDSIELGNYPEPYEFLSHSVLTLTAVNAVVSTHMIILCSYGSGVPNFYIKAPVRVATSLGSAHSTASRMDLRCHLRHGLQEGDSCTS